VERKLHLRSFLSPFAVRTVRKYVGATTGDPSQFSFNLLRPTRRYKPFVVGEACFAILSLGERRVNEARRQYVFDVVSASRPCLRRQRVADVLFGGNISRFWLPLRDPEAAPQRHTETSRTPLSLRGWLAEPAHWPCVPTGGRKRGAAKRPLDSTCALETLRGPGR